MPKAKPKECGMLYYEPFRAVPSVPVLWARIDPTHVMRSCTRPKGHEGKCGSQHSGA